MTWDALPAKVEGVIEKRIGRIEHGLRETLMVASVEGEVFTAEVLAQVQNQEVRGLVRRLSSELEKRHRLIQAHGLLRISQQRLSRYAFTHHLFQKYLYDSLSESERTYLHEDVGTVLEALHSGQTDAIAEQLSRHFLLAGLPEWAIPYLTQAGVRACQAAAYEEGIALYRQGLALLEHCPHTPERIVQEIMLQRYFGGALMATKGFADREAEQALERAQTLCQQLGDAPEIFPILYGLFGIYISRGNLDKAHDLSERLIELGQRTNRPILLPAALWAAGLILQLMGKNQAGRAHLEESLALYDPDLHASLPFVYGHDLQIGLLANYAGVLIGLGHLDQAMTAGIRSLSAAQQRTHLFSIAHPLSMLSIQHQIRGEVEETYARATDAVTLSTKYGFPFYLAVGRSLEGWSLVAKGQVDQGISRIQQGIAEFQVMQPYMHGLLADAYGRSGQIERGLSVLIDAQSIIQETGESWYEAELYRLQGQLLQSQGATDDEVEQCFHKALDLARHQQARLWELRTSMSLARLWQKQGKVAEAHETLAEIYGWFSEGFDTVDLRDAKELLLYKPATDSQNHGSILENYW